MCPNALSPVAGSGKRQQAKDLDRFELCGLDAMSFRLLLPCPGADALGVPESCSDMPSWFESPFSLPAIACAESKKCGEITFLSLTLASCRWLCSWPHSSLVRSLITGNLTGCGFHERTLSASNSLKIFLSL